MDFDAHSDAALMKRATCTRLSCHVLYAALCSLCYSLSEEYYQPWDSCTPCLQVMVYLHERGVKGFVTVNVLVFDEELAAVENHIRHIASCGVDAVIVQAGLASPCC